MSEIDIEREIELLQTTSDNSEVMIQAIVEVALKGYPYQWFLDNWFNIVTEGDWVTREEARFIKPWIETWAHEAYSRLEKETNQ